MAAKSKKKYWIRCGAHCNPTAMLFSSELMVTVRDHEGKWQFIIVPKDNVIRSSRVDVELSDPLNRLNIGCLDITRIRAKDEITTVALGDIDRGCLVVKTAEILHQSRENLERTLKRLEEEMGRTDAALYKKKCRAAGNLTGEIVLEAHTGLFKRRQK